VSKLTINRNELSVVDVFKPIINLLKEEKFMPKKAEKPKNKTGLRRLIEIAGTKKWWLFASMTTAFIATLVQFIPLIAVYLIMVELAAHAAELENLNRELLFTLGFISLGSVAAFGVLMYISLMLSHIAAFNILYEIRVKISEKLTKLSMGFFSRKSSGEINKVMAEDVEKIETFVAHNIPDTTAAIVFPIILVAYLFLVDWRLAIVAIIPLPIALLVQMKMMSGSKGKDLYREYHNSLQAINTAVVEYVRGMPVVKVFGATADSFQRLKETVNNYGDFSKRIAKDYSSVYPGFLTVISASLVFIIPVAVFLLTQSSVYSQFIPTVLLFLIIGGGMFFPLFKLLYAGGFLRNISIGVERIDDILYREEMIEIDSGKQPTDASIAFEDVSFAYEDKKTLDNISFYAEPGTITALVGPSGAGKTTIGLLSARFWDVLQGTVRIGGVDIREMKIETLMDYVSFVFQDGFLFFDTIEENIRMGNKNVTKNAIIEAAKAAQCHEFIENLPEGYDTMIGEGGTYLSGGEAQRISMARVILKDTPIIVLDEATAFADPENETKILQAFSRLIENKTVIVIAHRLSTIVNADQILVIDKGRIAQHGTHGELVASDGLYQRMWNSFTRSREWKIEQHGKLN
jgi:ATP-binding cassette subfamily B protein